MHEGPALGGAWPIRNQRLQGGGRSRGKVHPPPPAFIKSLLICKELETPPRERGELGHALYRGQAGVCLGLALRGCAFTAPQGAGRVSPDDGAERALRVCLVRPTLYAWENAASPRRCQESGVRETTRTDFYVASCTIGASPSSPKDLTDSFKETPTSVIDKITERGMNFG